MQSEKSGFGAFHSNDPEVIRFLQQLLQHDVKPTKLQNMVGVENQKMETKEVEASLGEASVKNEPEDLTVTKFSYLERKASVPVIETRSDACEYAKVSSVDEFWEAKRMEMIRLQQEPMDVEPAPQLDLPPLKMGANIANWASDSIYSNLPEAAKPELDRLLRVGHQQKVEVIQALNAENPVSYEYNAKKSRTRIQEPTSFRSRNNLASRRSRQRKKFVLQVKQSATDYEVDENFILIRQMNWLTGIVTRFEAQNLANGRTPQEILNLRAQCGLE